MTSTELWGRDENPSWRRGTHRFRDSPAHSGKMFSPGVGQPVSKSLHPARGQLPAWKSSLTAPHRNERLPPIDEFTCHDRGRRTQAENPTDVSLWGNVAASVTKPGSQSSSLPEGFLVMPSMPPTSLGYIPPLSPWSWGRRSSHQDRVMGILAWSLSPAAGWSSPPPSPVSRTLGCWRDLLFLLLCEGISGYRLYTDEVRYRYADSCF